MTDNRGVDGDPTDNRNGRLSAPRVEEGTYRSVSGHYARPPSCDGCDRTVFHERDHRRRKYIWCSTECRRHNEARVRRARRRKGLTCATCGESFDASRSDAKYCTDACRQKAYRERRGEEEAS